MVSFNTILKLGAVVAFVFSATATSTEVAQEQPKKESFVSRFFGKKEQPGTKPAELAKTRKTDTEGHSETGEPPKYSVEWHLFPKPENRAALRFVLPKDLAKEVPEDYKDPIGGDLEKRIKEHFTLHQQKQNSRRQFNY